MAVFNPGAGFKKALKIGKFGTLGWFVGAAAVTGVNALDVIEWDKAAFPVHFTNTGGVWSTDLNRNDYLPDSAIVTTYYCDRVAGSASNTGTGSMATAKQAPHQAVTAANATGQPAKIVLKAGQTWERGFGLTNNGTVFPTVPIIIVVEGGGRAAITTHDIIASWTASGTGYSTVLANIASVFDLNKDANGDYAPFARVASAAAVEAATSGGATRGGVYAQDGGKLVVKRWDGAAVTNANTRVFRRNVGSPLMLNASFAGKKLYVEGVDFEGGTGGGAVSIPSTATNVVALFKNCSMKYAIDEQGGVAYDAITFAGSGLAACDSCVFAQTGKDGANADATARGNFLFTMNCVGRAFGLLAASGSNNCYTLHGKSVGISVNDRWTDADGGNVRIIGDSRLLIVGAVAGPDRTGRGISNPVAFRTDETAIMLAIDCAANMNVPATEYAAQAVGTSEIRTRNFVSNGALVSAGVVALAGNVYLP